MRYTLINILLLWIISQSISTTYAQEVFPFQNNKLAIEERLDDLIDRLSLEEKASLMLYNNPAIERLGIQEYNWWNESLHGVGRAGKATVFPQAIGLAATFDEELVFQVATVISDEARAKHNAAIKKGNRQQYTGLSFWSPNVNIFRDPRWGRGQETYGEDPYLTSQMGISFVKGMQGDDPKFLKTSACAKHFVVHSGPEESRHRFNALPNEIDLRETYFPAFKSLVNNGVESVMCAYNRVYDEPCCGSTFLLKEVLLEEWGFKGHIVTDCWALDDIWLRHKVTDDKVMAAVMAVEAGSNLNCGYLYKFIPEAVERGLLSEEQLNEVMRPLLRTRFKLGLLDVKENNPYSGLSPEIVNSEEHRKLAYQAAVKSIVLLKNKNNILPLDTDKLHKLYVTGPTANDNTVLQGNYNGFSGNMVSMLEGIINKVDAGTVVDHYIGSLLNTNHEFNGTWNASNSDAVIACIGISRFLEGENGDALLSEHGGDRKEISLPQNQIDFIKKLRKDAKEKPLIVVITGGSAIAIPEIEEIADAILFVWYPGEQGGNALADIIFGNYNPAGRLPITFYKSVNDLPEFDDYNMDNRTYKYFKGTPLFEFGYGLSYSTFKYSDLQINKEKIKVDEDIIISFTLSNISDINGEEVVQLYVKENGQREKMPLKVLKRFKRVLVKAGEKTEISFSIPTEELSHWDIAKQEFVVEQTEFEIQLGSSSSDIRLKHSIMME